MKKLLVSLLLLTGAAFAQQTATTTTPVLTPGEVYSTDNLVQMTTTTSGSTWTNAVYQDQLSCMAMGMPGNCGPNPSVRPGNLINYSYGLTDIYQQVQLANSATLAVPGLRVNGYNFGFLAKNGNGWDDGRVDQLNAYVAFYGTDGKVKDYTNYDLNSKFDWTQFNYTKDFVSPYSISELSNVRYGFVGRDNNFWAGNYGPEIYNVSFSLKYSVDPCANDPLYSPTCPGYMDALNKLLPPVTVVEPTVTVTSITTETTAALPVTVSSPAPTSQTGAVSSVVSAPAPTTSSTTSSSSTASAAQSARESTQPSGSNVGLALSVIARNQERDAAGAAVAASAVSQAQSAANQAQQEAATVAASAVANSTVNNAAVLSTNNAGLGFRSVAATNNSTASTLTSQTLPGLSTIGANLPQTQPTTATALGSTASTQSLTSVQTQSSTVANTASVTVDNNIAAVSNFLMDRTSPINNIIENRMQLPTASTPNNTGPTVNTKASDNEAAGGVTIATMAVAPQGYGDYLNFVMRDAAFYAPREVYKNQRNVDNARVLRLLTNDSRHRDMVEQQYRR